MFERVTLTVSDLAASRRFYATVLGAIGHDGVRTEGAIDHLWIRVADLDAAAGHYRSMPGVVQVNAKPGERVTFEPAARDGGTFSVVADGRPATENLALALRRA